MLLRLIPSRFIELLLSPTAALCPLADGVLFSILLASLKTWSPFYASEYDLVLCLYGYLSLASIRMSSALSSENKKQIPIMIINHP